MTVPVTDLVDAGSGYIPGGQGPVLRQFCGRTACRRPPADGHDFCEPCLAWLRFDTHVDPLATEGGP